MAKKSVDAAAAKAKKQKIILAVGAVLLLGLGALQGPKLLSHGSSSSSSSSSGTDVGEPVSTAAPVAGSSSTAAPAVVPTATAVTLPSGKTAVVVAGVPLPVARVAAPATNQLASFTMFEAKDPFVPKVNDRISPAQAASDAYYNLNGQDPPASSSGSSTAPSDTGSGGGSTPSSDAAAPAASPPAPTVYATINLDGKPQQVKTKDEFPAKSPMFVLRSLKKKTAKIGVAGGSFDGGQAVVLQKGKKLTLVNTATGVRYVLKLVYTGAEPEAIQSFTTAPAAGGAAPAAASAPATTTTTTATTTTTSK